MPSCNRTPSYRLHKPSGQAVVTLEGRDIYLDRWNTPDSRGEYDRLISEWLVNGRRRSPSRVEREISINELMVRYWSFVERYYVKDGQASSEQEAIRQALRPVKHLYGHTPAREFGPLALK